MLGKQKIKCQIIYLTGWKWFTGCCYNAIYVNLSQGPDTWAIKICFSGVTDGRLKGIFWVFTDFGGLAVTNPRKLSRQTQAKTCIL